MTPEIKEKYDRVRAVCHSLACGLSLMTQEELEEFIKEAYPFADGTMAPIAAQFMGVQDLRETEKNLEKAIRVAKLLIQLRKEIFNGPGDGLIPR